MEDFKTKETVAKNTDVRFDKYKWFNAGTYDFRYESKELSEVAKKQAEAVKAISKILQQKLSPELQDYFYKLLNSVLEELRQIVEKSCSSDPGALKPITAEGLVKDLLANEAQKVQKPKEEKIENLEAKKLIAADVIKSLVEIYSLFLLEFNGLQVFNGKIDAFVQDLQKYIDPSNNSVDTTTILDNFLKITGFDEKFFAKKQQPQLKGKENIYIKIRDFVESRKENPNEQPKLGMVRELTEVERKEVYEGLLDEVMSKHKEIWQAIGGPEFVNPNTDSRYSSSFGRRN